MSEKICCDQLEREDRMNTFKLGLEIAKRRKKAGLTQRELAERIGSTQAVISRLESGRTLPSISTLERVARATGQPLKLVIGEDPNIPSRDEKRRRVRQVLGDYVFNPWDRSPSQTESRSLTADGLSRERFARE
jgi:transcriptional regulator with XRE-family HTH domain